MAVKRTGLGKGLDSMIPPKATQRAVKEDKNTVSKTGETILKINEVEPNKKQPRKFFNEEALQELSDSIKQHGHCQQRQLFENVFHGPETSFRNFCRT